MIFCCCTIFYTSLAALFRSREVEESEGQSVRESLHRISPAFLLRLNANQYSKYAIQSRLSSCLGNFQVYHLPYEQKTLPETRCFRRRMRQALMTAPADWTDYDNTSKRPGRVALRHHDTGPQFCFAFSTKKRLHWICLRIFSSLDLEY